MLEYFAEQKNNQHGSILAWLCEDSTLTENIEVEKMFPGILPVKDSLWNTYCKK